MRVVIILALYVKICVFSISRQLLGHDYDKTKTTARDCTADRPTYMYNSNNEYTNKVICIYIQI